MSVESVLANAASQIAGAISQAARSTGISFDYLLTTAQMESGLNPKAQAPTSSAKGLYQFIDQTWLATLKQNGPALGLGKYADAIQLDADGRYSVPDPTARTAILKLRSDPNASALMAGAFTRANATELAGAIGRAPTEGELYIAHFLGSAGAAKLISTASANPQAIAADMFPQAAAANRNIFYDKSGQARSAIGVYNNLTGRYEAARAVAFNSGLRGTIDAAATQPTPPDTAGIAQVFAQIGTQASTQTSTQADTQAGVQTGTQTGAQAGGKHPVHDTRPLFQAMFTDVARRGVSQAVNTLWAPATNVEQIGGEPSRLLDLFSNSRPDVRKLFGDKA
jgi:Transglycosylase SLT domain